MTRKDWNKKIVEYLGTFKNNLLNIDKLIELYPDQRFGQLVCNYICPDYRSEYKSLLTIMIMKELFDIDFDPFFEESKNTFDRLTKTKI